MAGPLLSAARHGAALAGFATCAASFILLPWATGRDVLAGRGFTGPELARLARNTDLLLDTSAGRPLAVLLAGALWSVPVACLLGALLLAGAPLTRNPQTARRIAAGCGAVAATFIAGTLALLAAGPGAGEALARAPTAGAILGLAGAALGMWRSAAEATTDV